MGSNAGRDPAVREEENGQRGGVIAGHERSYVQRPIRSARSHARHVMYI